MKPLAASILLAMPLLALAQGGPSFSAKSKVRVPQPLDSLRTPLTLADTLDPPDEELVRETVIAPPDRRPYVPTLGPVTASSSLGLIPDAIINSVKLYAAGNEAGAVATLNTAQSGVIATLSRFVGSENASKFQALGFGNNGSGATLTGNTFDDVLSLANPLNSAAFATAAGAVTVDCARQALDPRCASVWGPAPTQ